MSRYTLKVNGRTQSVEADPDTPLLYVLRNDLQLNGPKFGCGLAQCGTCSVHLDGEVARSCAIPVSAVAGRAITTLEGLMVDGKPGRVQQAFIDAQAVQCGYCTNGMVMASAALLVKNPRPTDAQINEALDGRCGTQQRICAAVKRAAQAA
jgi:nicotinate dehydrogenase subunit A